jgi:1-acyl-sn-glycerol-3-phosphate acyltransferase
MSRSLSRVLRGATVLVLMILNLVWWAGIVFFSVAFVKLLVSPLPDLRRRALLALAWVADHWTAGNAAICRLMLDTQWEVHGLGDLRTDGTYLIISNHLSWIDILALFLVFHGKAPFIRFFMKHQLLWMPIIGQACWAFEFPFMKRYSAEYLQKHPEKRGRDLATTRKACERYRNLPVTMLNFVEGTRFSREKQADQESPYRHLLRPRMGGIAYVLASLGDQLGEIIDVTLAYPGPGLDIELWDLISNQLPRVVVHARRLELPAEFCTPAVLEPGEVRERFKAWMHEVWREKDELLEKILGES